MTTFLPGDTLVLAHSAWPDWRTVLIIDTHIVDSIRMTMDGCPVTTMQRCTVLTSAGVTTCNIAWLVSNYDKVNR